MSWWFMRFGVGNTAVLAALVLVPVFMATGGLRSGASQQAAVPLPAVTSKLR